MPLPDTMFCAQQIHIPPELPDILKQFTKAAIRTQPADLLQWSAGYFLALSQGDPLPIKDRVELSMATQKTDTGLTQGLLRVLHKQCSHEACVALPELEHKWRTLCLPVEKLRALIGLDPCEDEIEWVKFLALGCSALGGCSHEACVALPELEHKWRTLCLPVEKLRALIGLDPCEDEIEWVKFLALGCSALGGSLNSAMKHFCEILTPDPEGGQARIPFDTFSYVYRYLSRLDSDVSALDTESYLAALQESVKNGMIGLSDFFV
ncbi:Ropporin-1-like protein [Heterocephalus glaber]|uniref:Ropporin-1-like protein n=1 Tax=Heterocephalus glaber TaxID=10181 RepID=G5BI14_HETGA|nr:Ropporin-1-like protein [Heterocephalus glaber]